jgi:hypothetical protein
MRLQRSSRSWRIECRIYAEVQLCTHAHSHSYRWLGSWRSRGATRAGYDLPPPALFMCEGSPASPRSPTGHPRNKQNGSEECPRSSYHAGRGHQVQGGRRPIMKIPFRVALRYSALLMERPARTAHRAYVPESAGLDLRLLPRALPHILCGDEYSCLLGLALL